jgi:hypothetical protein
MRSPITLARGVMLALAMTSPAVAQDNGREQPTASQQLQRIHTPQSIDLELTRLTKDLELNRRQRQRTLSLLNEHHDRIQALFDKYPTASRQELAQQIHAISDATHRAIHALLTDRQKALEAAMVERAHDVRRRPVDSR